MDWKKIGKKLLFPPLWLMVILTLISTAALTLVFVKGMEQSVPAYIVYVLAFYTLSTVSVFCALVLPKQYKEIKQKIYDNPLGNRFMTDRIFRINVSLSTAFLVSMLYVGINVWSWHKLCDLCNQSMAVETEKALLELITDIRRELMLPRRQSKKEVAAWRQPDSGQSKDG